MLQNRAAKRAVMTNELVGPDMAADTSVCVTGTLEPWTEGMHVLPQVMISRLQGGVRRWGNAHGLAFPSMIEERRSHTGMENGIPMDRLGVWQAQVGACWGNFGPLACATYRETSLKPPRQAPKHPNWAVPEPRQATRNGSPPVIHRCNDI